jgi:hypothetical protein
MGLDPRIFVPQQCRGERSRVNRKYVGGISIPSIGVHDQSKNSVQAMTVPCFLILPSAPEIDQFGSWASLVSEASVSKVPSAENAEAENV